MTKKATQNDSRRELYLTLAIGASMFAALFAYSILG
mgnify:CR=1 FL=1